MTTAHWISFASLAFTIFTSTAVLSFMLGRLSQRVTHVEQRTDSHGSVADKVTELGVEMRHANTTLSKQGSQLEGIHRQLANIATGRIGLGGEMG